MIHVTFSEPESDEWQTWCEECAREHHLVHKHLAEGAAFEFKSSLYGKFKETVYLSPEGCFGGKCAYCEQVIYPNQYGDLDHFRPKGGVKNEDNTPVVVTLTGQPREHPGYYWLAYDWRNLLPCCQLCNRPSAQRSGERSIGKRQYFPVRGFRAVAPGEEEKEEPLLLNPTIDDPGEHLQLDPQGVLYHRTDRGATTIRLLGLNERGLPDQRKTRYQEIQAKMRLLAHAAAGDPTGGEATRLLAELARIKAGYGPYAAAAQRAILDSSEGVRKALAGLGL